ncbi:MAG: helix-turn-helix domain-containing protein [Desulfococcaceae bacterium]
MNTSRIGGHFDDFLEGEGVLQELEALAAKRVLAFLIDQEMKQRGLSKTAMAKQMETSRAALDRLLNPENDAVTLKTMWKAASVLGKRLHIEIA